MTLGTSRTVLATELVSELFLIPSDTLGIFLHLRVRRPAHLTSFSPEKTIVMVHGATYSSGSLYDVPLGGYSFMDFLAASGFEVYALDVRGYGHSTRPPELEAPADQHPPAIGTEIGVTDFGTAVEYVRSRRNLPQVLVFAMSWGGTVAGAYTSRNNDRVRRLALLAPQWLSDLPIPLDPGGPLGVYRLVPVQETKARWLSGVPESVREGLIPAGWFEQWAEATLAEDPWNQEQTPQRLRACNGPIQDVRDYWLADRPFYPPSEIRVPTLLVHGEWDADVPIDLALAFFKQLSGAPTRTWVEIGEASHMLLLEKNRMAAFTTIRDFFLSDLMPEH